MFLEASHLVFQEKYTWIWFWKSSEFSERSVLKIWQNILRSSNPITFWPKKISLGRLKEDLAREIKSFVNEIETLGFRLRSGTNRVQRKFWCNLKCNQPEVKEIVRSLPHPNDKNPNPKIQMTKSKSKSKMQPSLGEDAGYCSVSSSSKWQKNINRDFFCFLTNFLSMAGMKKLSFFVKSLNSRKALLNPKCQVCPSLLLLFREQNLYVARLPPDLKKWIWHL